MTGSRLAVGNAIMYFLSGPTIQSSPIDWESPCCEPPPPLVIRNKAGLGFYVHPMRWLLVNSLKPIVDLFYPRVLDTSHPVEGVA